MNRKADVTGPMMLEGLEVGVVEVGRTKNGLRNALISSGADSMDGAEYGAYLANMLGMSFQWAEETWKPTTRESLSYRPNFGFNACMAMAKGCFHSPKKSSKSNRKNFAKAKVRITIEHGGVPERAEIHTVGSKASCPATRCCRMRPKTNCLGPLASR